MEHSPDGERLVAWGAKFIFQHLPQPLSLTEISVCNRATVSPRDAGRDGAFFVSGAPHRGYMGSVPGQRQAKAEVQGVAGRVTKVIRIATSCYLLAGQMKRESLEIYLDLLAIT